MANLPSFAVIIPMYNEATGAEVCVRRVCAQLSQTPHRTNLVVINDGSTDGTKEILDALEPIEHKLIVVNHPKNRGYGAALCTGICKAAQGGFDYALFMDSDLTNDPADIPKFTPHMERGADVIKASRFIRGGKMQGVPWRRAIFSRTGNLIARALFRVGLHDCTNGFRAVKVAILTRLDLKELGFAIIMEELYKTKYVARIFREVPITLTARRSDQRLTSFQYKPEIFFKYLAYAFKAFLGVPPSLKQEIAG